MSAKSEKIVFMTLFFLLLFIMIYLMSNTPIIKGFFTMSESFVSSSDRVTVPICPTGFKEYIFGGDKKTYCCRGTVNADATTVQGSCKRAIEKMENSFCTLGASSVDAPNCSEFVHAMLREKGTSFCPASKPNYSFANRCCSSSVTSDGSDCSDTKAGSFCTVGEAADLFKTDKGGSGDCAYQRMKESDTCPPDYSKSDTQYTSGPLAGLSVYSCFDNISKTCFTQNIVGELKKKGVDVSRLPICGDKCVKGIGKLVQNPLFGDMMLYSDDECKSLGGAISPYIRDMCFNSEKDLKEYNKYYGSAIDSGLKSGELFNVANNEEEKKKNDKFIKDTLIPLLKKYSRNFDCV
jgi:hypothetical protein